MIRLGNAIRRGLSRRLVRAARDPERRPDMSLGELIRGLGDRSFGWCIVLFALISMLPMPIGSNMITAIPLILLTGQMALGLPQVWLPDWVMRRRISRKRFQRRVLWLGPLIRPIERIVRARYAAMFTPRAERGLGVFLLLVAIALFAPIPLSSYLPATALLLAGIGLVERDGAVVVAALVLGMVAILVTASVTAALLMGVDALTHRGPVSP
ncbi:MAG TPA: exopolysaccharide biosynthesis protein [Amaricoccus sp.]|uniref:exopolysaccharide biosynthesis protein n=1 Tax=Amaricoccus sp. TaxID=1872485 RepID=UPI001D4B7C45|nr:exopolysaccharide biosynthesis protein [Amaricoccus sp.]MCB1374444.1 exopolysaccharide biosynthesis protein [Paracoccaceae bacterium]MCC0068213.1 exopolysaccharide biosynthesis protein [Rhodovulum sp.]MCB1402610.1 exopolysaccharide biosynthesis protein [Paracoccaceae bacterium]HPG21192.1 exopolysaccharide biosynthesis protein [Amaricoccus sp.]HRW16329.1 exopolysaccharide biosynthesis protein [Amaricoccus sp.]